MPLQQTPLYEKHLALNAKMIPFGGWEMPLQYDGILAEYDNTRERVSVFDTSHMGEFFIEGDAVASGLNTIITQPVKDMPVKTCRYGAMLNDKGGIMDDLIVYRVAQEKWMIVVNSATMEKDARQFQTHITGRGTFINRSAETGKLDIQGPLSRDILHSLVEGIERLDYYTFDEFEVLGENVIVSRTGYTGELGYEIYFPWERTKELWDTILSQGVKPAGLGVRDVLRIEMGYSLYGHELNEDISPLDAGLNRFIDLEKDFIGKQALQREKEAGGGSKVICFASETRRSPRADHKIYSPQGEEIGRVTSGTFSPHLQRGIGLGFVAKDRCTKGDNIFFGNEKDHFSAVVHTRPFYNKGTLKK